MNSYVESRVGGASGDGGDNDSECRGAVSYAEVAARLLQDNLLLTALELHTELVESGRELPQLREFFSNPGNFEQHVSRPDTVIHRTPSQATLDSLDLARYSEDGAPGVGGGGGIGGSDVAVLEFELRKARDTINSLRANLTQFADVDSSGNKREGFNRGTLKPHEKRALNFLVNEYLLLQEYKLTAITFSDENPDQDFEDWDDVGLNVPRPCGLIFLYRGEPAPTTAPLRDAHTETESSTVDVECQTDPLDEMCVSCQTSFNEDTDWSHEMIVGAEEVLLLKRQVVALESDKANYQKLYDAALASLNSLVTPVSESSGLSLAIPAERLATAKSSLERMCDQRLMYAENHYGSNASTNSVTPEQFEMIDCDKHSGSVQKEGSTTSSYEVTRVAADSSSLRRGSTATLDDTISLNEASEWTRLHLPDTVPSSTDTWIGSSLPRKFKSSLLRQCCQASEDSMHDLLTGILGMDKPISTIDYVSLVADTLLRIIPQTLVSRRCEAAALLAATIHLLSASASSAPCTAAPTALGASAPGASAPGASAPGASAPAATALAARRARLLQLLLTLLKKPDPVETNIITDAVRVIVKWGGSWEVLSCIAELLASRSTERRTLAARVCLAIVPHVAVELCASLVLSLALLMCESSDRDVRLLGLKAAALVCPVAEHKYAQMESVFFAMLKDPAEEIRTCCVCVFAPVLARSAIITGKFTTDLCNKVMVQLAKYSSESDWKNAALYLDIIRVLSVAILAHVTNVQIVKNNATEYCDERDTKSIEISLDDSIGVTLDLQCYLCEYAEPKSLVGTLNRLVRETPEIMWPELEWFLDKIIKRLLDISITCKLLNDPQTYHTFINIFHTYCKLFGADFTSHAIKPIFTATTQHIEKKLETLQPIESSSAVSAGIMLVAILPCSSIGEVEIRPFFQKWVVCIGVCGLPVDVLSEPLRWTTTHAPHVLDHCLLCLREIIATSYSSSMGAPVRASLAALLTELVSCGDLPETCVDAHIMPELVALLHDADGSVRERAVTALGALTREAAGRRLACLPRCWAALEGAVEAVGAGVAAGAVSAAGAGVVAGTNGAAGACEAARMADVLAALLAPGVEGGNAAFTLKVTMLLCRLCERAPLTGAVLSSLLPALQLAVHLATPGDAHPHDSLLPALRRLEKMDHPSLQQHKLALDSLLASLTSVPASDSASPTRTTNIRAGSEAVGRRVTQIFQQSKTNMSIPNIFKKKS